VYNNSSVYNSSVDNSSVDNSSVDKADVKTNLDYCTFVNFGSRNGATTFYRNKERGIQVRCGCFNGSLSEFIDRVKYTHRGNKHEKEYLAMVEMAKIKMEV
jgi:hypothetical protein